MRSYDSDRLHKLAKNILIGMELVDKRVDSIKKANVKKELNEEETRQAIAETNAFFADRKMQRKLEALKSLIVDDTYQNRLNEMYAGQSMNVTPQSRLDEMNMKVTYNPYNEKD
jgi:hypothetical protein